jgi:hypothetical protein
MLPGLHSFMPGSKRPQASCALSRLTAGLVPGRPGLPPPSRSKSATPARTTSERWARPFSGGAERARSAGAIQARAALRASPNDLNAAAGLIRPVSPRAKRKHSESGWLSPLQALSSLTESGSAELGQEHDDGNAGCQHPTPTLFSHRAAGVPTPMPARSHRSAERKRMQRREMLPWPQLSECQP